MENAFRVGFLLYPGLTQLDLTGPAQVLTRMPGAQVDFVWKTLAPARSDCGFSLTPTMRLEDAPQFDLICVPGGFSCTDVMDDEETLRWLQEQAAAARYLTSVCTGSLILAAAGLLTGLRAGCHWAWRDQLALFGAIPDSARVVVDGNRITAGGVTAGIDFAFTLVREIAGPDAAEAIMLALEYDPTPGARGTPHLARPEVLRSVQASMEARLGDRRRRIAEISTRRGPEAAGRAARP